MINPNDVVIILGQRGSGKSTLGRIIASSFGHIIVLDRLREWTGYPTFDRFGDFASYLHARASDLNPFTVVFQVSEDETRKDEVVTQVFRLAYKWGKITGIPTCLLVEEVHHFAAPLGINQWFFECVTTGRHANLAIIASTQRPLSVSKHLLSAANHLFVGRLFETRDLMYLGDILPESDIEKLPSLQNRQFLHYRPGLPSTVINT